MKEFVDIILILGLLLLAQLAHQSAPESFLAFFPTARVPFHLPRVQARAVDSANN
jgi:hypothetical protein